MLDRGNVDSIYPNAPDAKQRKAEGTFTEAPFLSPALAFSTPEAADFLGAGDFDGDSHWDVVAARKGSVRLYLLSGDGRGGLKHTRQIELAGKVTAMTVGEINRRDGLDDVVVGVATEEGAKVLVFEGPEGALRASPEAFDLTAEPTSLALGQLDDEYTYDLAIAAGSELMIVRGRDRRLSLDAEQQAAIQPAEVDARAFPYEIRSIAIGDFKQSSEQEIAMLCGDGKLRVLSSEERRGIPVKSQAEVMAEGEWSARARLVSVRSSSLPLDNVLTIDEGNNRMEIAICGMERDSIGQAVMAIPNEPIITEISAETEVTTALPMRLNKDALSDLVMLRASQSRVTVVQTQPQAVFTVTNTKDNGLGSLRDAINQANANPGADAISVNILPPGPKTISLLSPLPTINDPVTIDGINQAGIVASGMTEIDGQQAGSFASGLDLAAGNSVIRNLVINRFSRLGCSAIDITNNGNRVEGNFIGTDATGTSALGNLTGVVLSNARSTTIGGTTPQARNIISGNCGAGVNISGSGDAFTGNQVQGNYIGTDVTGTRPLPNCIGERVVLWPM